MITRRLAFIALACSALSKNVRAQDAQGAPPVAFVQTTVGRLIAVINGPAAGEDADRQLQAIVDGAVDVNGIAQFCLGRFWRTATPTQQQDYLALFHRVLMNGITGNVTGYKGVTVAVSRAQQSEEGDIVSTVVNRPGQATANVGWVVVNTTNGLRIEDVVVANTSLRLTKRSEYDAFLTQHDGKVGALLEAMRAHLQAS